MPTSAFVFWNTFEASGGSLLATLLTPTVTLKPSSVLFRCRCEKSYPKPRSNELNDETVPKSVVSAPPVSTLWTLSIQVTAT